MKSLSLASGRGRFTVAKRKPPLSLSGILPGYSCKEGKRRTPIRIPP
jgi:hypothetical protein